SFQIKVKAASNPDPNTFDRTLVTVRAGKSTFTFRVDDLKPGPIFLPELGVAILPENDKRDYAAVARDQKGLKTKTLYDRVAEMPGTKADEAVPAADSFAVLMLRFVFTNISGSTQTARLPLYYRAGEAAKPLIVGEHGALMLGEHFRAQVAYESQPQSEKDTLI